jgi:hypothetical protein
MIHNRCHYHNYHNYCTTLFDDATNFTLVFEHHPRTTTKQHSSMDGGSPVGGGTLVLSLTLTLTLTLTHLYRICELQSQQ